MYIVKSMKKHVKTLFFMAALVAGLFYTCKWMHDNASHDAEDQNARDFQRAWKGK